MKYFSLIWANLFRKKTRTVLTLLSIMIAFLLFGLLQAVNHAFNTGANEADADRLFTNSRYSIIDMLPESYQQQIASVPGVKSVAFATWFGGSYQDKPAPFAIFPVRPAEYLRVAPEIVVDDATLKKWESTRTGAIVGESFAKKMGWKVGDKIPIKADIWPQRDGSILWTFDVVGTFRNTKDPANGESALVFQYDYFDEARQFGNGTVGWFLVKVDDPKNADRVSKQIDALFANSSNETKTQTEKAFAQSFAKQIGDIGLIVTAILGAVMFTILVLTGNTMSQALRERIPELGILKTLGFTNQAVWWFVLLESLLLSLIGAALGLALSAIVITALSAQLSGFGLSGLKPIVVAQGVGLALVLGLAVGIIPAISAMRLKIIDALNA